MKPGLYIFTLLVLLVSGCSKRYWFRIKVPGSVKEVHTVNVRLINLSPQALGPVFEQRYEAAVYESLRKYGFVQSDKEPAEYTFTITMFLEVSTVGGVSEFGDGNTKQGNGEEVNVYRPTRYANHRYTKNVSNINFKYALEQTMRRKVLWSRADYVYFRQQEQLDVKRSVSLLNLALRRKGD